ncbi:hypothetical protein FPSE5266_00256 [Fusarium pseudograminearum]|nr:hypothetical protein FPSE5266_00256 [Fusarium pseudograminearum]
MDDDAARTKNVGATSNKRLDDGDENNEGGDDSEEGDNSDEQNQQPSKRPRIDGETAFKTTNTIDYVGQGTGDDFGATLDANASMSQELITMTIAVAISTMSSS